MKQKDIAIIIVVVFVTGVASFFISNKLFAVPNDQQAEVEVVQPISAEFPTPDERYFNDKSFDPTQPITIGEDENEQPFNQNQTGN